MRFLTCHLDGAHGTMHDQRVEIYALLKKLHTIVMASGNVIVFEGLLRGGEWLVVVGGGRSEMEDRRRGAATERQIVGRG